MSDNANTTVAVHNLDQQQQDNEPNPKVEGADGKGMNRDLNSDMHAMFVKNDEPHQYQQMVFARHYDS